MSSSPKMGAKMAPVRPKLAPGVALCSRDIDIHLDLDLDKNIAIDIDKHLDTHRL